MSYRKIDVVNVHEVHMQGPALHLPHTPNLAPKKNPNRPRPSRGVPASGSPAVDPRAGPARKTKLLTVNSEEASEDDMAAPLIKNKMPNVKGAPQEEESCCCVIS